MNVRSGREARKQLDSTAGEFLTLRASSCWNLLWRATLPGSFYLVLLGILPCAVGSVLGIPD